MKNILFISLILLFVNIAKSQEEAEIVKVVSENESKLESNRIGFTYSTLSGYGLTYLHTLDNGFSFKTQLFIYGEINNDDDFVNADVWGAIGGELQYNIKNFKRNRLYALVGFYFDYDYSEFGLRYATELSIKRLYNGGIGVGFETLVLKNISLALDGGYYGRIIRGNYKDANKPSKIDLEVGFGFGFGVSLYYNF